MGKISKMSKLKAEKHSSVHSITSLSTVRQNGEKRSGTNYIKSSASWIKPAWIIWNGAFWAALIQYVFFLQYDTISAVKPGNTQ